MIRPHLGFGGSLGQFEDFAFDLGVDDFGAFDYASDFGGDFGGDFAFDDFGGDFAFDDFGGDFAFDDFGGEDWGLDTFDLGGEELSFDEFGVMGDPWSEEFDFGFDFGSTENVALPDADTGMFDFDFGGFNVPWDKLVTGATTIGSKLIEADVQKTAIEARAPTAIPRPSILPSPSGSLTSPYREVVNPNTGQRVLLDTRTGKIVPSTLNPTTGKLVPTAQSAADGIISFIKDNPVPILAGVGLLAFVLLKDNGKRKRT